VGSFRGINTARLCLSFLSYVNNHFLATFSKRTTQKTNVLLALGSFCISKIEQEPMECSFTCSSIPKISCQLANEVCVDNVNTAFYLSDLIVFFFLSSTPDFWLLFEFQPTPCHVSLAPERLHLVKIPSVFIAWILCGDRTLK
jgi:hypothetical protein